MSVRWMAEVFELANLSESDGWLLLAIADHADDEGVAYPSVARLAHKTGWHPRTIQRAMRRFESRGLLQKVAPEHAGHARKYRLAFAGLARKLAFRTPGNIAPPLAPAAAPGTALPPQGRPPVSPHPRHPVPPEPSVTVKEPPLSRKRRLPPDFAFGEHLRRIASDAGCRLPDGLFAAFCDYWRGTGTPMLDWVATFRTWARRAHGGPPGLACGCGGLPRAVTTAAKQRRAAPVAAIPDEKPDRSPEAIAKVKDIMGSLPWAK